MCETIEMRIFRIDRQRQDFLRDKKIHSASFSAKTTHHAQNRSHSRDNLASALASHSLSLEKSRRISHQIVYGCANLFSTSADFSRVSHRTICVRVFSHTYDFIDFTLTSCVIYTASSLLLVIYFLYCFFYL